MNKKYYWLKLKEDFFEEETIEWVEEQENGKDYVLFYLKLCLKAINSNGILIRKVGDMLIPYDAKKLGEITHTAIDTVRAAMNILQAVKLIEVLDNGEIYLSQMASMIGSETDKAALMRKSRENKKIESASGNNEVTMLPEESNTDIKSVTPEIRDKRKDKDKEKEKNKKENVMSGVVGEEELHVEEVKARKTNFDSIIDEYTVNPELKQSLKDFIKMRKANKSVITDRALKGICNKLDVLAPQDDVGKIQILEQSIINAWKSVYPVKEPVKEGGNVYANNSSRMVETNASGGPRSDYDISDGMV